MNSFEEPIFCSECGNIIVENSNWDKSKDYRCVRCMFKGVEKK